MSTKAQVKTQAKTPAAPSASRIPQPPVPELEHEAERPDIAAQLEGAARLGHSLGAISVTSAAPPQNQPRPLIQRQELPEEEEEELQAEPVGALHAATQAKLTVSAPNDIYEQEADRVAEAVTKSINTPLQRQTPEEEEQPLQGKLIVQKQSPEEEEELQAWLAENGPADVSVDLESRINAARAGGQPLAEKTRLPMEEAFGADFSDVRLHTDSEADALNQQLGAKAFTTGQDVFFREGEYSPSSDSGSKLIAHELTHVVQQTSRYSSPGEPKTGFQLDNKVVQRVTADGEQEENDWVRVAHGGQITYTNLSAGCMAVTAFDPGGGSGIHLPMMEETPGIWPAFEASLGAINTLHVDVDTFNSPEGWRVKVVKGNVVANERFEATTTLVETRGLTLEEPSATIRDGDGEWVFDELRIKQWFVAHFGVVPKFHFREEVPGYNVP